jgi:hypothetical protein
MISQALQFPVERLKVSRANKISAFDFCADPLDELEIVVPYAALCDSQSGMGR